MPSRPGKACRVNNCSNVAKAGQYQGYCEQHKHLGGWYANEAIKGNKHQRGYGKQWQQLRQQVIKRDAGLCQECKRNKHYTKGSHVDHIKPKSQGGTDALNNLQLLCVDCHNHKTSTERVRG